MQIHEIIRLLQNGDWRHSLHDILIPALHTLVMKRKSSKRQFLMAARAFNERARLVDSSLFQQSDFFDPRDKVQAKYEMLRAAHVDGIAVSETSRQFGYSRESFYTCTEVFREKGIVGLVDTKRGPKQPRKLTSQIQRYLVKELEKKPSISGSELAGRVAEKFGVNVHRRSIERFIVAHRKKNDVSKSEQKEGQ